MNVEEKNTANAEICELMKEILSDQFLLYVKARNFHWNVSGPQFFGLHSAFEKIYDELSEEIDAVAERIRTIGFSTPGTMKEFWEFSTLEEKPGELPESIEMVRILSNDFETIIQKLQSSAHRMQDELKDEVTAGMLYGLAEKYQKTNWMLKSNIEK